jgi:hypothetical protein
MRRRIAATALAAATLLTGVPLAAASAAQTPAAVSADDIFYPGDAAPADPADDAANDQSTDAPAGDAPISSRDDREAALMRGDRQAADTIGWMPSLYQGKWFMPAKEDIRRCIMDRESNFNYRAVGAGTYFGAYQMNRSLAVAATYTMQKEVAKELGAEGVAIVKALRGKNPNSWNRYWQDRAFWTIWANGNGKHHWSGGGLNCF